MVPYNSPQFTSCHGRYGIVESSAANRRGVTPPQLRRISAIAARLGAGVFGLLVAAGLIASSHPWHQSVPPPGELAVEPHVDYVGSILFKTST